MNRVTSIGHDRYHDNQCASKGCNNQGRHFLTVLVLNKAGHFCDSCKVSLLKDNLVEEPKEEA